MKLGRLLREPGTYLVLVVAIAGPVAVWLSDHNFWLDESMLFRAIALQPLLPPGVPLANYEQALPYGTYLLFKGLIHLVGFSPLVLELPSLLALDVVVACVYLGARYSAGRFASLLATVVMLVGVEEVYQATAFKHYEIEVAASAVIILLAKRVLDRRSPRSVVVLAVAGVVSLAFSFTSVIVAGGCFAVLVLAGLVARRTEPAAPLPLRWLIGCFAAFVAAFIAVYVAVTLPQTVYQLAYPNYDSSGLPTFLDSLNALFDPRPIPAGAKYAYFGLAVCAAIWVAWAALRILGRPVRRATWLLFDSVLLPLVVLACLVSTVTDLAPFIATRNLLFALPVFALPLASGLALLGRALAGVRPLALTAAIVSIALAAGITGSYLYRMSTFVYREAVGNAIASAPATCDALAPFALTQPTAEIYAPLYRPRIPLIATISSASGIGTDSWYYRGAHNDFTAYAGAFAKTLQKYPTPCIVTGTDRFHEVGVLVAAVESRGYVCDVAVQKAPRGTIYQCRR